MQIGAYQQLTYSQNRLFSTFWTQKTVLKEAIQHIAGSSFILFQWDNSLTQTQ